ncbi:IS3 family transposase [Actinoplanes awajinensis]|uniref:IS3 family transposase n=1 Tax=Actinoplanes awajinensis TaxID=135946 RepID=UPI00082B2D38|nr:IS3 family transposase [Actinoplanes awajinensis]
MAGFIVAQRAQFHIPYAVSCRALGVSPAWLYKWLPGDTSLRRARRQALTALVVTLFARHKGRYGSPRITDDLRAMGWRVSVNTIAKIMAGQHLVARPKRRRRNLTQPDGSARKAPDLLNRDFTPPPVPDVAWVGDLTEIPCEQGKFYLAIVLDLHSRRAVGFAMGAHHDGALATAALQVAVAVRGCDVAGVIFHSDQGGEYTGNLFRAACARARVRQSMGRTGSALDNAVAESFNSTLEFELLARAGRYATRAQARAEVAGFIGEYNNQRRHSTAGRLPPVVYEARVRAERAA